MSDHTHDHDEQVFGYKVKHVLEHGLENIDGITRNKLMAARQKALARQKTAVAGLSLAGVGNFTHYVLLPRTRTLLAMVALTIGVIGTYYWQEMTEAEENAEIDSALLSNELPINAYLDHGFHAWLEEPESSQDSQLPQE